MEGPGDDKGVRSAVSGLDRTGKDCIVRIGEVRQSGLAGRHDERERKRQAGIFIRYKSKKARREVETKSGIRNKRDKIKVYRKVSSTI